MATRLVRTIATLLTVGFAWVALAPAASAATYTVKFSGVVVCDSSSKAVTGVYVNNFHGSDGWASWTAYPGKKNAALYSFTTKASRSNPTIRLDIGCGGTTKSWEKNLRTPNFTVKNGSVDNRRCRTASANKTIACYPAPAGPKTSSNWGYAGYCTWGAYSRWKSYTGYYPAIGGDARQMDDNAKAKGLYVSTVPHANSMVVFNTGTFGHVGWVTKVYFSSGKVYFDYVDMNGGSTWVNEADGITNMFNKWSTKTKKAWNTANQAFIVAPD
ncbi:CHAP domain-containing protein [Demequina mangrovi]|uniref:CHAP domain-containing protein n=1 Tax=Demequina mangrovi TaxID=1043493 RepID=A0A1H6ZFA4_9MICO|nr:CHAP domain-containing protein [Demequina mangrovi]SEJ51988.1 CHAP domain-containing protein [Demequina mangrovi]